MTYAMLVQHSRTGDSSRYSSRSLGLTSTSPVTRAYSAQTADSVSAEHERAWDTAFASDAFSAMVAKARAEIAAGDTEPSDRNHF